MYSVCFKYNLKMMMMMVRYDIEADEDEDKVQTGKVVHLLKTMKHQTGQCLK